jgi:hypothetical protein
MDNEGRDVSAGRRRADDEGFARATDLLEQVIETEVHLEDGLIAAFVMQADDECARRGRQDVKVDVGAAGEGRGAVSYPCPSAQVVTVDESQPHAPILWDIALENDALLLKLSVRETVRAEELRLGLLLLLAADSRDADGDLALLLGARPADVLQI